MPYMFFSKDSKSAQDVIADAKKILILPQSLDSFDAFCAATGLYKALKNAGKNVSLSFPGIFPETHKKVLPEEELTNLPQTRDLVISIDYSGTEVEKINYAVEESICKIVVHPISKDFAMERISYVKSGFDYDLVITVGIRNFNEVLSDYKEYEKDFSETFVINIDNSRKNENFASLNIVETDEESLSQLILNKLVLFKIKINSETAKALLKGISGQNN